MKAAGFHEINHSYLKPSSAIRSGQVVKKIAKVKLKQALEDGDAVSAEESSEFMSRMQLRELPKQHIGISLSAKRNTISLKPLSDDVHKFSV